MEKIIEKLQEKVNIFKKIDKLAREKGYDVWQNTKDKSIYGITHNRESGNKMILCEGTLDKIEIYLQKHNVNY